MKEKKKKSKVIKEVKDIPENKIQKEVTSSTMKM